MMAVFAVDTSVLSLAFQSASSSGFLGRGTAGLAANVTFASLNRIVHFATFASKENLCEDPLQSSFRIFAQKFSSRSFFVTCLHVQESSTKATRSAAFFGLRHEAVRQVHGKHSVSRAPAREKGALSSYQRPSKVGHGRGKSNLNKCTFEVVETHSPFFPLDERFQQTGFVICHQNGLSRI